MLMNSIMVTVMAAVKSCLGYKFFYPRDSVGKSLYMYDMHYLVYFSIDFK